MVSKRKCNLKKERNKRGENGNERMNECKADERERERERMNERERENKRERERREGIPAVGLCLHTY